MTSTSPTIGILKCGTAPPELQQQHGDYDQMFIDLLGPSLQYRIYQVEANELPEHADETDGWLITGSRHGVYEGHAWIAPLEQLLRDAYKLKVPIVGICFGHQLLAQALGGHVEKFKGGWSVGQVEYQLDGEDTPTCVNAMHQDQVMEAPADAVTFGSTDFCKHAFLRYGDQAFTMQPHPEFTDPYTEELVAIRKNIITPAGTAEAALKNFTRELAQARWAEEIRAFFLQRVKKSDGPAQQKL